MRNMHLSSGPILQNKRHIRLLMMCMLCLLPVFHTLAGGRSGDGLQNTLENSEPSGIVVLTFDDGSKTNLDYVAPLLKEFGFGATFFVTHQWMLDTLNFLNWTEIAKLHQMGFEIGNHSWTHSIFAQPRSAAALAGELGLVEWELRMVGVPKPVSFAYCASGFGPEAVDILKVKGYRFARRGTEPEDFIILDLPEAMFTQFGLTFLGHKHIPTYFDYRNIMIQNSDWQRNMDGSLSNQWRLPNKMIVGAHVKPSKDFVDMELWIKNETEHTSFTNLKSQVCVMFSYATQFNGQSNENKIFDHPVTAVKAEDGNQWILTAWNGCDTVWGNEDCPCMHSDPYLPVCPSGHTVRTTGRIWFYEGENIQEEISSAKQRFTN